MTMATCLSIVAVCAGTTLFDQPTATPPEQLIVFVAPERSDLARTFEAEHLPSIRKVAQALGIPVRVVDTSGGAPKEVAITPLLVFQDHRGRSVYQGRYANVDRIRNFLRTSRVVGQGDEGLNLSDVPVWRSGRAHIAGMLKVAPVSGKTPRNHDPDKFAVEAMRQIRKGLRKFKSTRSITLGRSDRKFYLDFNPWLSDDNTLYLSVSLFSQFHCKEPVLMLPGSKFVGPWRDRKRLFRRAATALERAIVDTLASSRLGDGFDAVPKRTPDVTWSALGLALPPKPESETSRSAGASLSRRWKLSSKRDGDASFLAFHFPAPLDSYAGEVGAVEGELIFDADLSIASATGHFQADPASVTMGEPDLDHALHGAAFLDARRFPVSRFVLESIEAEPGALAFGRQVPVTMRGSFLMKGVTVPLSARAFFEPVIGAGGGARLLVTGRFSLSVAAFSIEGPDGPEPAKDTLVLDFSFSMAPASN